MFRDGSGEQDTLSCCSASSSEYMSLSSVDSHLFSASPVNNFSNLSTGYCPGASTFVPTVTEISHSPELQWLERASSVTGLAEQSRPYDAAYSAPRGAGRRRRRDEQLSPEEDARRHIRRERNKQAAARCRTRRRELTDSLESVRTPFSEREVPAGYIELHPKVNLLLIDSFPSSSLCLQETSKLAEEQDRLRGHIMALQKEKEQFELLLSSHEFSCSLPPEPDQNVPAETLLPQAGPVSFSSEGSTRPLMKRRPPLQIKLEPVSPQTELVDNEPMSDVDFVPGKTSVQEWPEDLHTPVIVSSTPRSMPSMGSSLIFTYPNMGSFTDPLYDPCTSCSTALRRVANGSCSDMVEEALLSPTLLSL
uniref:fos-related antigen 2-like isoform X1 n=1 Tax=Myxine glutinosa TaxID=7769 RepID=UPI00358FBA12